MADLLSDEVLNPVIVEVNDLLLNRLRIVHLNLACDMTACKLLDQKGCTSCRKRNYSRISASLVTERGVCLETVALGCLADRARVEICALEEYIDGGLCNTGVNASEHACDAHRALRIGNDHIIGVKISLHPVESHDLLALTCPADNDLAAGDLVSVEGMQWLTKLEEHEIGNVNHVVDRVETDCKQFLLEPFRRGANLHVPDGNSVIFRRSVHILNLYRDGLTLTFGKCRNIRIGE